MGWYRPDEGKDRSAVSTGRTLVILPMLNEVGSALRALAGVVVALAAAVVSSFSSCAPSAPSQSHEETIRLTVSILSPFSSFLTFSLALALAVVLRTAFFSSFFFFSSTFFAATGYA
jgi:hypothetical protein